MVRRASLVAVLLASLLLPAEGASPRVLRFPFWAASDGKGTVSLFWLPLGGQWPAGGYRLERVSRGRTTVLAGPIRPGQDARSMMELDPANADAIRALADKIERGTLTDDERSRSISVLGRAASADTLLGRALGVRYVDVPGARGKLVYRLTALGADGGTGTAMESTEVDPGKATPAPARPVGLRAEERTGGVALFWTDPPASPVAPVVGYRVDRGDGGKRMAPLNGKPLLLDRHLRRGEPEFLDGAAPAKTLTYQVRSVDVFGRMSAPVRVGIAATNVARAEGSPGAEAKAPGAAAPAATPVSSARIAAAATGPAGARTESARGDPRISMPEPARDRLSPAASGGRSTPGALASAAAPATAPETGRGGSSPRIPVPPADARPAPEAPAAAVWTAAKAEPTARQVGPPPPPVIVGISGMADRVVVRFRPGEPEALTQAFLVVRSESPTGTGVAVGRPIPGDAREWQDTTVAAGQFFWYRLVAVDGSGNRSEPSKPKWVSTGSR